MIIHTIFIIIVLNMNMNMNMNLNKCIKRYNYIIKITKKININILL